MQIKKVGVLLISAVLTAVLTGCAVVELKPQGEKVRILAQQEVGRCKRLGHITTNTVATFGFLARPKEGVVEDVQRLARNNAAGMGGDTVVATSPLIDGEQSFDVYRCINP